MERLEQQGLQTAIELMEEMISASEENIGTASVAEQVIERFEDAFIKLTAEGTALLKASTKEENRTANNRPTNAFMVKYYTMRQEVLEPYENLLSQLTSMQEEDETVNRFIEYTVSVQMTPAFNALVQKLDKIINGEVESTATTLRPAEATTTRDE